MDPASSLLHIISANTMYSSHHPQASESRNFTLISESTITKKSSSPLSSSMRGLKYHLNPLFMVICLCLVSFTLVSGSRFFADDSQLQQTVAYDFVREGQKEEIQQEILSIMGIDHKPSPKPNEKFVPKHLIDIYRDLLDSDSGNLKEFEGPITLEGETLSRTSVRAINMSDKIISFSNQIHHRSNKMKHDRERRFLFDLTHVTPQDEVMEGEFRIFRSLKNSFHPLNWTYTLSLFQVIERGGNTKKLRKIESKDITMDQYGWIMFNITHSLEHWVMYPEENHGLYLKVRTDQLPHDLDPQDIGLTGYKGLKESQPFLLGFFKSNDLTSSVSSRSRSKPKRKQPQSRPKRAKSYYDDDDSWNPLNPIDKSAMKSCQKKTLFVSFYDLGWQDWIIAPDGYAAFYCGGECSFPLVPNMNATNHAIVQTLIHLMIPTIPKPCCAPSQLSSIKVLYYDDYSNVILKKYKNMEVKSCGCH